MKANELRIGNLINIDDCLTEIAGITKSTVFFDGGFQMFIAGGIEPIPLTEDWLLKFGFKKIGRAYKLINFGKFIFHDYMGISFYPAGLVNSLLRSDFLKYVHQLQNLYFALTGEELLIKDQNDN